MGHLNVQNWMKLLMAPVVVLGLWCGASMAQDAQETPETSQAPEVSNESVEPRRETAPAAPMRREVELVSPKGFDHYAYILRNNIFSRDRKPGLTPDQLRQQREEDNRPAPVVDPLSFVKLVGVSEPDERRVAFFVDTRSGQLTRVEAGGEVSGVKIASVSLDGVSYADAEGGEVKIVVGKMLNGADGVSGSSYRSYSSGGSSFDSSSAPSSPTGASSGGSGSEVDEQRSSLLQRLLEQRRQEK
jgi:hypothetical protein